MTCDVRRISFHLLRLTPNAPGNVAAVYILSDCSPPPPSSQAQSLDYTKTVGFSGANTTLFVVLSLAGAAGCLVFLTLRTPDPKSVAPHLLFASARTITNADAKFLLFFHLTLPPLHFHPPSSPPPPPSSPAGSAPKSTCRSFRCALKSWAW